MKTNLDFLERVPGATPKMARRASLWPFELVETVERSFGGPPAWQHKSRRFRHSFGCQFVSKARNFQ